MKFSKKLIFPFLQACMSLGDCYLAAAESTKKISAGEFSIQKFVKSTNYKTTAERLINWEGINYEK